MSNDLAGCGAPIATSRIAHFGARSASPTGSLCEGPVCGPSDLAERLAQAIGPGDWPRRWLTRRARSNPAPELPPPRAGVGPNWPAAGGAMHRLAPRPQEAGHTGRERQHGSGTMAAPLGHSSGTALALLWHCPGTALAQLGHRSGTPCGLQATGSGPGLEGRRPPSLGPLRQCRCVDRLSSTHDGRSLLTLGSGSRIRPYPKFIDVVVRLDVHVSAFVILACNCDSAIPAAEPERT